MTKKSHKTGHRHSHERQFKNIVLLGAAFVVVMLIAIGYRQSVASRYTARVYEPLSADQIRIAERPSTPDGAGACCGEGECLDLNREECSEGGYVFWPDADLCLTACGVTR